MQSGITSAIEIGAIGGTVFLALYMMLMVLWIRRRTPLGIARRLRNKGGTVQFRVGYLGGGWNPAGTRATGWTVPGPGALTYELSPDGDVHLTLVDRSGHETHYQGPLPAHDDVRTPAQERLQRMRRGVTYGFLGLLVVGFAVGFAVASGSGVAKVFAGCIGIFVAMVVAAIASLVLRVVLAIRGLTRHDDFPQHSVGDT